MFDHQIIMLANCEPISYGYVLSHIYYNFKRMNKFCAWVCQDPRLQNRGTQGSNVLFQHRHDSLFLAMIVTKHSEQNRSCHNWALKLIYSHITVGPSSQSCALGVGIVKSQFQYFPLINLQFVGLEPQGHNTWSPKVLNDQFLMLLCVPSLHRVPHDFYS